MCEFYGELLRICIILVIVLTAFQNDKSYLFLALF